MLGDRRGILAEAGRDGRVIVVDVIDEMSTRGDGGVVRRREQELGLAADHRRAGQCRERNAESFRVVEHLGVDEQGVHRPGLAGAVVRSAVAQHQGHGDSGGGKVPCEREAASRCPRQCATVPQVRSVENEHQVRHDTLPASSSRCSSANPMATDRGTHPGSVRLISVGSTTEHGRRVARNRVRSNSGTKSRPVSPRSISRTPSPVVACPVPTL